MSDARTPADQVATARSSDLGRPATSEIRRNGVRVQHGVTVQRYKCQPTIGDPAHQFFAPMAGDEPVQPAPPSPPENCPNHPISRMFRDGKTSGARCVERRRYRCFPKNGDGPHRFTPALSRLVVNHGDACPTSATHRAINQGDINAAMAPLHVGHRRPVADPARRGDEVN